MPDMPDAMKEYCVLMPRPFENSAESSQPHLGGLKSQRLEILLIQNFGYDWRGFILQRRRDAAIA